MTYDGANKNIVLFGGATHTGATNAETWLYSPGTGMWAQQSPATSPPATAYQSMAYLPGTGVLMFGGYTGSAYLQTVWLWDGTTWTDLTGTLTGSPPSLRAASSIAYSAALNALVVFGGQLGSGGYGSDTYSLTGAAWTTLSPSGSPSARGYAPMAPRSDGDIVLYGGEKTGGFDYDTYRFDGTNWNAEESSYTPTPGAGVTMCYAASLNSPVLLSPITATLTSVYAAGSWSNYNPSTNISSTRQAPGLAEDGSGGLIAFGGLSGSVDLDDTWALRGAGPFFHHHYIGV